MNSFHPLVALFFLATVLLFSACEKDPTAECVQEIITDPNYFAVERTLRNGCLKTQGIDYVLTGNQTYVVSANLIIESGTLIELEDSASLLIDTTGTLQALGTPEEPIIIRGDFRSTGHWRGIFVRSSASNNKLQHVRIQQAGGASIAGETARGALVLLGEGHLAVNSTKIEGSASYGINVASSMADLSEFNENILTKNMIPLRLHTTQANSLSPSSNLQGNTNDYIEFSIQSPMATAYNWPRLNVPYRMMALDNNPSSAIQSIVGFGSLTVDPGCTVEMSSETGFSLRDQAQLSAVGTSSELILFTGVQKGYGTWRGFEFRFTPQDNRFEHVRIEHAGSQNGVLYMWGDPRLTCLNTEVTYSPTCGFYDAPKTANQSINSNLVFDVAFSYVSSEYCKGN